jgi:DNA-binding transcriptional LysR family regulator
MWERACSRRRTDIQHQCRPIQRIREQARSHTGSSQPFDLHKDLQWPPRRNGNLRLRGGNRLVFRGGRIRVNAAEGLREAVLAHQGLTMASEWMFAPELADGPVREVVMDGTVPNLDLWAMFPTGRMASAKARAFVEYVQALLKNEV